MQSTLWTSQGFDNATINNIQLIDLIGRKQKLNHTLSLIDLVGVPEGLYILQIGLDDTRLVTKKIMIINDF